MPFLIRPEQKLSVVIKYDDNHLIWTELSVVIEDNDIF